MSTDHVKAHWSALVVLSSVLEPQTTEEHLRLAKQTLVGWTLHSSFQFASGKRFRAEMDHVTDVRVRATWALAHVVAKAFTSTNNWSGAGKPTREDLQRYERLAAALTSGDAAGDG